MEIMIFNSCTLPRQAAIDTKFYSGNSNEVGNTVQIIGFKACNGIDDRSSLAVITIQALFTLCIQFD